MLQIARRACKKRDGCGNDDKRRNKPLLRPCLPQRLLVDGTGSAPFRGELAIPAKRIAAIGPAGTVPPGSGAHEHDLKGRALSPGFIDTHTHDDRIVLDAPDMLPKISQGVTTVVTGNCGISLAPVTFAGDPPAPMNLLGSQQGI